MMPINSAYNERFKRGTPAFPFDYHFIDLRHPRFVMPFHYHVEMELVRVRKGGLSLLLNEKKYYLRPGDFLIIEGGVVHGGYTDNRDDFYECIVFNPSSVFDVRHPIQAEFKDLVDGTLSLDTLYRTEEAPAIAAVFNEFFDEVGSKNGSGLLAYAALTRLFALILKEGRFKRADSTAASRYLRLVRQGSFVFRYIFDNYAADITLEDLASCVGLNAKYFCKVFKELTGDRPIDYLNRFRIECSTVRLTASSEPISQIAYACGFKDPCYFTKLFKRYKKLSPREFRLLHQSSTAA